jgi:hypothetical protein
VEGRKSKVAWSGMWRSGGNAQGETENELRKVIDEFGILLEDEAKKSNVNICSFPLFREFNVVAAVTLNKLFYMFSPSVGGIPILKCLDFRKESKQATIDGLISSVKQKYGWTDLWYVDFSSDLLAKEPQARLNDLHSRAREKVQDIQRKRFYDRR